MGAELSKTGERLLAHAERVIEDGLSTFMKVGKALTEIRDGRLYRAEYETFEDYCRGRWGFSRQRAHQLIEAAEVSTIVDVANEAQARALAPVANDPAAAREVWEEANEDGPATAAKIAQAVQRRTTTTTETTETTFDPSTGEIIQTSGEGAPSPSTATATAGQPSAPSPVLPAVDPVLGYRARATAERSKVRSGLLILDPARVVETSDDHKAWADISRDVRAWLDQLDTHLSGPRLKAVQ